MEDSSELVAASGPSADTPLLSLRGLWKVFEGVPVLKGIDFDLKPGEIHALLGGNGSGKSTTVKLMSGAYKPTAGTIELDGQPVRFDGPSDAHDLGIYMVPQEPHIFPHLSVEENLLIGEGGQSQDALERARRLAREMGLESDFFAPAGSLSIANQQLIEIVRGLLRNARVLIFDEPTSALTIREVKSLFQHMKRLSEHGIGIFFISHRLNEVLEISDRVSVLRDGVFVLSAATENLDASDLIKAMLPGSSREEVGAVSVDQDKVMGPAQPGSPVLEVSNLSGEMFHNVSFQVCPGEVVGLAGLVGAGRTELAEAILGIDKHVAGEVRINGKVAAERTPRRCQQLGLAYVPEDRHAHGIFLELPNVHTTTASVLRKLGRFLLSTRREYGIANQFIERLGIKTSGLSQLARTLSGGNQQKVVLAKTLATQPRIIILDEPTRGIDAQARQDVYRIVRELTGQDVAILLISSELEEVIGLSNRVLVMYRGRVEELPPSEIGIETVTAASFGLQGGVAA